MIPPECRGDVTVGDGGDRGDGLLDVALRALADERRRHVVYELRDNHGVLEAAELARCLAEEFDADTDAVHTHLHHTDLPRLSECGIVEYDPEEGSVRYAGGSTVTDLVRTIAEYE